jgi:hypothetical protein
LTGRPVQQAAGYSGTPLPRKLGIKEGHRVALPGAPPLWAIEGLPEGVEVSTNTTGEPFDVVVAFFTERASMTAAVAVLSRSITVDGALWMAWPRRAGGHRSDITDNVVRELALPIGLVDVKVAALDQDWSAVKFVWRKERREGLRKGLA